MDKRLNDSNRLRAIEQAKAFYDAQHLTKDQRFNQVVALAEWGIFSIAQLAQISRFSTATLYGWHLNTGAGSGNFNPQSLDTMRLVLLNRIAGKRPNIILIEALVRDGNSHRTIYKFTGVQPSTISRMMKRINGTDRG